MKTILSKPYCAGEKRLTADAWQASQLFQYDQQSRNLIAVEQNTVPYTLGYDDSNLPHTFYQENGWLLELTTLIGREQRWCIFFDLLTKEIVLDIGTERIGLHPSSVEIEVKFFLFFAYVRLTSRDGRTLCSRCFLFPWGRSWFVDGDTKSMECHAATHIFSELGSEAGYETWKKYWSTGLRNVSTAITFDNSIIWQKP